MLATERLVLSLDPRISVSADQDLYSLHIKEINNQVGAVGSVVVAAVFIVFLLVSFCLSVCLSVVVVVVVFIVFLLVCRSLPVCLSVCLSDCLTVSLSLNKTIVIACMVSTTSVASVQLFFCFVLQYV